MRRSRDTGSKCSDDDENWNNFIFLTNEGATIVYVVLVWKETCFHFMCFMDHQQHKILLCELCGGQLHINGWMDGKLTFEAFLPSWSHVIITITGIASIHYNMFIVTVLEWCLEWRGVKSNCGDDDGGELTTRKSCKVNTSCISANHR